VNRRTPRTGRPSGVLLYVAGWLAIGAAVVAGVLAWLALGAVERLIPTGGDVTGVGAKIALLAEAVLVTLVGGAAYAGAALLLGVGELRTIASILVDLIPRRGRT
jgi:hypothetical protein